MGNFPSGRDGTFDELVSWRDVTQLEALGFVLIVKSELTEIFFWGDWDGGGNKMLMTFGDPCNSGFEIIFTGTFDAVV